MEDQQLDPDDLTGEHPDGNTPTVGAETAVAVLGNRRPRRQLDRTPRGKRGRRPKTVAADTGAHAADVDAADSDDADTHGLDAHADADADDTKTTDEHGVGDAAPAGRRFSRWQTVAVGIAALAFVGSLTFAGAALPTYMADRAAASTRIDVARTAVAAVTTLWTYTPDTIDTLPDRAAQYLSGDFNAQYRKFLDAAAAPNKQAQMTNSTEVVGAGVESLNGSDAVAIVFTNTTATSPLTKNVPSLKYVGYRLAMKRQGSRWLVTNMSTVSFMDLTPQL